MKRTIEILILGIFAGIAISIGGWLYVKTSDKVLASFLFSIGLILIVNFKFLLYTGQICYLPDHFKKEPYPYWLKLIVMLIGNYIGCYIMGFVLSSIFTVPDKAFLIVESKLSLNLIQVFGAGFFCGLLINFAVDGFKTIDNIFGKYVVLVMCVAGFIIADFEHCVADKFYLALVRNNSFTGTKFMLFVLLGNTFGGQLYPFAKKIINKLNKEKEVIENE